MQFVREQPVHPSTEPDDKPLSSEPETGEPDRTRKQYLFGKAKDFAKKRGCMIHCKVIRDQLHYATELVNPQWLTIKEFTIRELKDV